jgi:hypothetical protein
MSSVLYAAWLRPSDDVATESPHGSEFLSAVAKLDGVGHTALYRLSQGGSAMKELSTRLSRIDHPALAEGRPAEFVLAELESLDVAVDVGNAFGATSDEPRAEYGLVDQALFHEIDYVAGPADVAGGEFAPAVQFGVLNVKAVANEWQINEWYERLRLLAVAAIEGQVRTRRYVSVAGRAKYAILYEFLSLEARLVGFEEPHEAKSLDDRHPTSALRRYTVHAPGAPFVGVRVL